jgi:hypothetical protein
MAWGVYNRRAAFCRGFFLWAKESMYRIFINKCFLFTLRSVCSVQRFTTRSKILSRTLKSRIWWATMCGSGWDNSQKLPCCGFRSTGKAMGQVYQCLRRICREINVFFSGSNITCFALYIHLWPIYWLSLVSSRNRCTLWHTKLSVC